MKRIGWIIALLLFLLLIFLLFLFFSPKSDTEKSNNLAFPESGNAVRSVGGEDQEVLVGDGSFRLSVVREAPSSGDIPTPPTSQGSLVQYEAPSATPYIPPKVTAPVNPALPPLRVVRRPATSVTSPSLSQILANNRSVYIPPVVPPPYPTAYYIPPPPGTTGPVLVGRSRGGSDIIFDPITGDLRVGDLHFNFGMGPVPSGGTSDVVGDPDNTALGTTIGILVGSLVGDPGLGLILGTALGSNLFNGFTLQDLGIGLEGGMLTLGGENILSSILGDSAIGSALDSITGGLGGALGGSLGIGGGNSYFGGKNVISTICTCSLGTDYIWVVTNPPQYMGSYLFSPLSSKIYEQYTFIGTFNALGSYSPGEGECLMYHGEECDDELSKITKGKINSKPGVGTAAGI